MFDPSLSVVRWPRSTSTARCVQCSLPIVVILILASELAPAAQSLSDLTGPWQLFVDDYLIAQKTQVLRTYHPFAKHPGNPVLAPDKPWEGTNVYVYGSALPAESGHGYRMWYHALPGDEDYYRLLYAVSEDGIRWDKPNLGIVTYKGSTDNNIFIRRGKRDHIPSVIHTPWQADPQRRYTMINFDGAAGGYVAAWSADGLHWKDASAKPVFDRGGDVGQFFWDSHTSQYLGYVKNNADVSGMRRRSVARIATKDITSWPDPELVLTPDTFDDRWAKGIQRTHFYGLSAFAYESMYLGFVWVFRATDSEGYFDGTIFVELVTSRDGIHWLREEGERPPILPLGASGEWDSGMVFTTQQPMVVDGQVWLYYGGFDCTHAARPPWHGAIGLATLRKDGFASLDAAAATGIVTTKRLSGAQGPLRVNCQTRDGWLRVEVLDEEGAPLPGYSREDCAPLTGDHLDQRVTWGSKTELPVRTAPLRLRFVMKDASLYAFAAGESVKVLDEPPGPVLGALYTFEGDQGRTATDKLTEDKAQKLHVHGDLKVETKRENAAFGEHAMPLGSKYAPWSTLEIDGTRELGKHFTLAVMAKSNDNACARLFSSYDDRGPVRTTELVFDCDPKGQTMPGLRLICKGIPVESKPLSFADGKYHHLAVVYDDGGITFYLDGADVGGGRVPGGDAVSMERSLYIGEDAQHGHEEQFKGYMDDLLVLGRALGPTDMAALAQRGAAALLCPAR